MNRPARTPARLTFRAAGLTTLAMLAFAGNSLLCRVALRDTAIDPASFTTVRLISGALALALIVRLRGGKGSGRANWGSAFALFVYAAAFSWAYVSLPAATGALLLFGAVQATMIGRGLFGGERLNMLQTSGLIAAIAGLLLLLMPGIGAPPLVGAALMLGAGVAWGVYSLRGRGAADPIGITAGNFLYAVPPAVVVSALTLHHAAADLPGILYAVASGALTSGIGYAVWYSALPALKATQAATVQLSVPVIAAVGGIVLLGEPAGWRLILASLAILGGIGLVLFERPRAPDPQS